MLNLNGWTVDEDMIDAFVGADEIIGADDFTMSGADDFTMSGADALLGADPDLRSLLSVSGDDYMSGADVALGTEEVIGFQGGPNLVQQNRRLMMALRRAQQIGRRAQQNAMASRTPQINPLVHPFAVQVQKREPQQARIQPLGINSIIPILPGATFPVVSSPQVMFKGTRLLIPNDIAGLFDILDVKVGNRSQLPASGPLPGRTFAETAVSDNLILDTAQISQQIIFLVQNVSTIPAIFKATLLGTSVM